MLTDIEGNRLLKEKNVMMDIAPMSSFVKPKVDLNRYNRKEN